jgi:Tfp pilus assembly protein PilW
MECKITSTRARAGAVIAEWVIAVGIGGLLLAVIAAFSLYSARSFVTLGNYTDLDGQSRIAVDRMGQEIREATQVVSCTASQLTVLVGTNQVSYTYLPDQKVLTRQLGTQNPQVLLKGCDSARFDIYQRQATNADWQVVQVYPVATADTAKIVQLTWACSRSILGKKATTESMQSARIVIRKQAK